MLLTLWFACTCGSQPLAVVEASAFANVGAAEVTEALHGDGRSYLRISEASYDFWVSVPALEVRVGDSILLGTGPLREHVHSADLGRDFDAMTEIEAAKVGKVADAILAPPAGGIAIQTVYAQKAALAGTPVKVRGRVVKANLGIFGKNWYHLRDGSGVEGSNDLVVTTSAEARLGDTVVAEAPLTIDRDFGFGYFFMVILEDASVAVEGAVAVVPPTAALPVAEAQAPLVAAAAHAVNPQPRRAGLPPAPTRSAFGLEIGAADEAGLAVWAAARKLTCTSQPAARRATLRTECNGGLATTTFPERSSSGKYTQLLLSRTEAGPFHYLSLTRRYSIPAQAGREFESTLATLKVAFGEPTQSRPFDATRLTGRIVRFAAGWSFSDLDVHLSLFRATGESITVTETWSVPGVEAGVGARAGTTGHGEIAAKPAGWNPHVVEPPSGGQPGK